ncbi:MAG: hypothetical protein ACI9SQ_001154 [Rubritalea sp.]|jgi:hypothetical protein
MSSKPVQSSNTLLKQKKWLRVCFFIAFAGFFMLAGWFSYGFMDGTIFNKPSVYQPTAIESLPVLGEISNPNEQSGAQQAFWNFVHKYKEQALTESTSGALEVKGECPAFIYLPQSENVLGNRTEAQAHLALFKKRYQWVEPLIKSYDVEVVVSEKFGGTVKEMGHHYYYKLKNTSQKYFLAFRAKADEQTLAKIRKDYVGFFLEAALVSDYLMARANDKQREQAVFILDEILSSMKFDVYFAKFYKEMELPAIEQLYWPALSNHPKLFSPGIMSRISAVYYAVKLYDDKVNVPYINYTLWFLRTPDLVCWEEVDNDRFHHAMVLNSLAAFNETKYSFYWIHVGMKGHLSPTNLGIARHLLNKIHKKSAPAVVQQYNRLLKQAYPQQ